MTREPDVQWPAEPVLAVNIVINFEEGAHRSVLLGDPTTEPMGEQPVALLPGESDLLLESCYEFGADTGVHRVLAALDAAQAPATVFGCGRSYETYPEIAAAFAARNFDVVGHGYRWAPSVGLSLADMAADIARTSEAVRATTGQELVGWFSRSPADAMSREAAAAAGLLFDSMSCGDDIPYFERVADRPFLVVPYTTDLNDIRYWRGNLFTGDDFAEYVRDALTVLLREVRAGAVRTMSIGLHPRIIGRPGRIHGLWRVLELLTEQSDIWITSRSAIAAAWLTAYAPENTWNWPPAADPAHDDESRDR